jgi:hypothetical protein
VFVDSDLPSLDILIERRNKLNTGNSKSEHNMKTYVLHGDIETEIAKQKISEVIKH